VAIGDHVLAQQRVRTRTIVLGRHAEHRRVWRRLTGDLRSELSLMAGDGDEVRHPGAHPGRLHCRHRAVENPACRTAPGSTSPRCCTLPHHQTLRATIDWSYQLLAEPEQQLLARPAVFAGGCTLDAAETVCGGDGIYPDTVFELLASLVARSLVVTEEHGPETRYRLLETIRQYGEKHLTETGETDPWQARHGDYYVVVLKQIRHHDRREEVFWAVRLRTEQDNLLAAWSWAIDTRNIDTAFRMLAGFAPSEVWTRCPLLLDGEAALELPGAKSGTRCALEAEHGVQVFAHHSMLKLGSLAEKIGQLLAALHHNCRLSAHERKLSPRREPCSMMRTSRRRWELADAQCITVDKQPDRSAKTPAAISTQFCPAMPIEGVVASRT
jgi:hypothetical protein